MNIKGCVALVTGANRGLGKAIVSALVEAGAAKVYAAARDERSVSADSSRVVPLNAARGRRLHQRTTCNSEP
jgi:NAD(P)-dependent dehydrogenase (short-subunit alcohol dehydrogenase family)